MILSDDQAIETIKSPQSKAHIESIKIYESKLRVYTEELDESELPEEQYWSTYLKEMESIVSNKYETISKYMRYPLPIVQVTDSILNDFFKVFEGKNRFFNIDSERDITALKQWVEENNLEDWVEQTSRKVFKNKPMTIVVVDRNKDGIPYLIDIDSERLVDAIVKDKDGNLEYVSFIHSVGEESGRTFKMISVYDDERYMVFKKFDDSDGFTLEVNIEHGIGYCPAKLFLKSPSNSKNPFKRRVAFGQSLSKLYDWCKFDIFRNYVDHYVPFPVTEAPAKRCKNNRCKDGKVEEEEVLNQATGEKRTKWTTCPVCEGKDKSGLIGPGTHIQIRLQADKTKEDGSGKFKMHFPETDKMDYIPNKLENLETEIRLKTVGVNDLLGSESVNEIQVKGSFASMDNVLMRTKEELDYIYKWVVKVVGELFYTNESINIEANFGTEWYLVSEEELQNRFDNARKIGLPKSEQILIYEQLIDTKYKGNSTKIARQKMLLRLDPFPLYSNEEVLKLYDKTIINYSELHFKINFYKFVTQFEEENTVITEFGINLEIHRRVEIILETLNKYNDDYIKGKQLQASNQATGGNQGDDGTGNGQTPEGNQGQ